VGRSTETAARSIAPFARTSCAGAAATGRTAGGGAAVAVGAAVLAAGAGGGGGAAGAAGAGALAAGGAPGASGKTASCDGVKSTALVCMFSCPVIGADDARSPENANTAAVYCLVVSRTSPRKSAERALPGRSCSRST
jgi:hypothetical protein